METLYWQAKAIERIAENLNEVNPDYPLNVADQHKILFQGYERNPIFNDAITERQSIEKSLEELAKDNKGIGKILPWRKDEEHNKRLEQLGELVTEPYHLHKGGIWMPDNLITISAETTAMAFGISYFTFRYLTNLDALPEETIQGIKTMKILLPTTISILTSAFFGLLLNSRRYNNLPIDEARYLDEKVKEFY